jgi:gliding motility-associated-like protein
MLQKLIAPLALLNNRVFLTLTLLISCTLAIGQITINTPTLGFSQVCASTTFNTYNLSFSFSPASNLGSGNIFTVELSNASGSFASPTILTTSGSTNSPTGVTFSFPTTVDGTGYRIRIKSSSPVSTSPSSVAFSANYAVYNQPFTINNNVSNQAICSTSNFNLSIDSGPNSPLNFSELTYRWYIGNTLIPGQTSSSIPITQAGNYRVEVNYGTCSLNAYSNVVTVTITQSETLTISSQGNSTTICPSTGLLLSSAIASSGYTYQWYRNSVLIPGATNATYSAIQEGDYSLKASNSICNIDSNILTLTENTFSVSLDSGAEINLLPGQTKILNCTTTAVNPSYTWYKNNIVIPSQTSNSLTVNETGTYKVVVRQNSSCVIEKEASTLVSAPTSYDLSIKHSASYVVCENLSETLTIDAFEAEASLGTITIPANIGVTYKWYKNGVEINGATSTSYTISNYVNNDVYSIEATFMGGQTVSSNTLDVKLKIDENLTLTADGILCSSNTAVTITSSITNPIFNYQWFKDGEGNVLGNNTTFEATEAGNYFLTLSFMGCELSSELITVENIDEEIIVTNYDEEIFINEGEEITITATGGDSYEWFIDSVLQGSSNEILVNQEADVQLVAQVNGCEIVKNFTVLLQPQVFNLVIPNTITPNNDGKNDTWIITEELAYKNDVEIVIFSSNQQIVYRTNNYQNNWPLETIVKSNKIFYYTILKNNSILYRGTISVIQ